MEMRKIVAPAAYTHRGGGSLLVAVRSRVAAADGRPFQDRSAPMPISLLQCSQLLSLDGVRHHVDAGEGVIRAIFVTRQYKNLRGEKLIVMNIELPDGGYRCRVSIPRAFAVEGDVAATCLSLCRLAADTPLVAVEYDADFEDLRIVSEVPVEDGGLTGLQLLSMVDRCVEAAEIWAASLADLSGSRRKRRAA